LTWDTVVIRTPCGLSGDMLLCGFAKLLGIDDAALAQRVALIRLPSLSGKLCLQHHLVSGIAGWTARVSLPDEHTHRRLAEIVSIINASDIGTGARRLALATFQRLADVEAEMHGIAVCDVHFHEIGALDSILDICMVAALYVELGSPEVICSPLPVSDGIVHCSHGLLATPAPAVLRMLEGVPVYGVEGAGETVTPTALALLLAMNTRFGVWPALIIERTARIYGTRVFSGLPNGAIFAVGHRWSSPEEQHEQDSESSHEHTVQSHHHD